ncbi:MAG: hypothetical protein ACE5OR_03485 [bacterium]
MKKAFRDLEIMSVFSLVIAALVLAIEYYVGDNIKVNQDQTNYKQSETSIAIDPTNSNNLVGGWIDWRNSGGAASKYAVAWGYSTDGGATWQDGVFDPSPNYSTANPSVTVDDDGNFYFCYLALDNGTTIRSVYVHKSTNGGETWGPRKTVVEHTSPEEDQADKPYIVADQSGTTNNVYEGAIKFCRSTDSGDSWSDPIQISYTSISKYGLNGACPAVGLDNKVYVAWFDDIYNKIYFNKSTDGGVTWKFESTQRSDFDPVVENIVDPETGFGAVHDDAFPSLVADPNNDGYLYLTWADKRHGTTDILFRRSINGGDSWGPIKTINDDGANKAQFYPWIATDEIGNIVIVFYDNRNSPSNKVDLYLAESKDRGVNFSENIKVTSDQSDPSVGAFAWFKDYIGVAYGGGHALPLWMDSRSQTNLDIYTAEVDLPPRGPTNLSWHKDNNHPHLTWDANEESDLSGYNIYRNVGCGYSLIAFVSKPTTDYLDEDITVYGGKFPPNHAYYYVKAVDTADPQALKSDKSNTIAVPTNQVCKQIAEGGVLPREYGLIQIYPNPFNPRANIDYRLPETAWISLAIFNTLGQQVRILVESEQEPGFYTQEWDGRDDSGQPVPSGFSFCCLTAGYFSQTRPMVLMK